LSGAGREREPARILLVRTSALGDVVHALPVLAAVRRRFPSAAIGWVVDESFAPLLEGHAFLDRVFPVPLRRWRRRDGGRRARELAAFARALRGFRADVALDLMGNHKAALLARLSGAPRRIGLRRPERREPSSALWLNETVASDGVHAVERMLAVATPLGVDAAPVDFAPEALACGRDEAASGDFVFLHPGAAWGNKRYPPERWGRVAELVAAGSGLEVRVGAGPGEAELAERIVAASRGAARRHDAPSLAGLAGAVRSARLVLAGDTGALHLARALGRPLVAVHGPTDPSRHGPFGALADAVWVELPCSFCHRRMDEAKPCLLRIEPETIAARALSALAPGPVLQESEPLLHSPGASSPSRGESRPAAGRRSRALADRPSRPGPSEPTE
jgi:lipopolysaccharide heptosyltransferase I